MELANIVSLDILYAGARQRFTGRYNMPEHTVMSYTVRDELGTEASTVAYISYDGALETVDALIGEWLDYGALLDAATGGQIVGGRITIALSPDGSWKSAPASGSRVEQTGLVNFSATGSSKRWGADIPALVNTAIAAGKILTASGPVHALILAILAAFTNGNFTTSTGGDIATFRDAAVTFRKHRRQLTKATEVFHD